MSPSQDGSDLISKLEKIRFDWDARALQNARHFIATQQTEWSDEEFFASGETNVSDHILTDMTNICQRKSPKDMRVLEIGCGAGRITRALAHHFGEVFGVDVSSEMIRCARESLRGVPNAHVFQNNGMDLGVLPPIPFDFAFSMIVFQHIPSYGIIESYAREVSRLLRPGALFKFQVQGYIDPERTDGDTWLGVGLCQEQAVLMAARTGFELRYDHGAGTQDFWLWFFKDSLLWSSNRLIHGSGSER